MASVLKPESSCRNYSDRTKFIIDRNKNIIANINNIIDRNNFIIANTKNIIANKNSISDNKNSISDRNKNISDNTSILPVQYGQNVKSYQYLPYKRMIAFFKDMFSLSISEGSIDSMMEKMSQKTESAYGTIRERINESVVVGSDETGYRVNGKKHWFHVWQNELLTFIVSIAL